MTCTQTLLAENRRTKERVQVLQLFGISEQLHLCILSLNAYRLWILFWNKKGRRQDILLHWVGIYPADVLQRTPFGAGPGTIGFSLFQYKDLLSRLCFSRALHSANCFDFIINQPPVITISITWWWRLCLIFVITAPQFWHWALAVFLLFSSATISSAQFGQYHFWDFTLYRVVL